MLSSLNGLSHLLASSLLATSFAAPLEWSPNGRWLAYTSLDAESTSILREGWLSSPAASASAAPAPPPSRSGPSHRVWASRFNSPESVLIEESRWPLSSPTWSKDGRSLVFGRFVPASDDADQTLVHGRYEVVVQTGLDQKKSIVVVPELSLEPDALSAIIHLKPEISPDGRYLAAPRPGKPAGVALVRLDTGAVVKTIAGAKHPSWAPDGVRLLFVLESQNAAGDAARTLHVLNRDLGSARPAPTDLALLDVPPIWALDGQSILTVAQPPPALARNLQVDLYRIGFGAVAVSRMITLEAVATTAAIQQGRLGGRLLPPRGNVPRAPLPVVVRGAFSLDREQEECIALIEISGQPQALRWCNVRSQRVAKLLNPLDLHITIGAPAISPDGQSVAFRAEAAGTLGLPAVCDLNTEAVTPIAPDESTRRVWLERLASCATDVLKPGIEARGLREPAALATNLPSPVELAGDNPVRSRLRRLAKYADALLDQPPPADGRDAPATRESAALDEIRLFFDYLSGDYQSAGARLDEVTASSNDPEARLRWLCLRAQILLGQGEVERARGISAYLSQAAKSRSHAVEETPLGSVLTTITNPNAEWAARLAQSLSPEALARLGDRLGSGLGGDDFIDVSNAIELDAFSGRPMDARPQFPFVPPDPAPGGDGFDPNRFGGPMLVEPPAPRFPLGPGVEPSRPPDAPILPRL